MFLTEESDLGSSESQPPSTRQARRVAGSHIRLPVT
jgi:hypothetical protein